MTELAGSFALGVVLVAAGAVVLARGAVRVARQLGASPFVAGVALAAFASSAPVLAISLTAALKHSPGIALGVIFGCNTANIGLVLGLAAVVRPVAGRVLLIRNQIPILVAANLLFWFLSRDNVFSRTDGYVLLGAFVGWLVVSARSIPRGLTASVPDIPPGPVWLTRVVVAVGLAVIAAGAQLLVASAVRMHAPLGVTEWTLGLTLVAAAASVPVLVQTLSAAWRDRPDVVLGTVIGANLVNLLLVLGVSLVVNPLTVKDTALFREVPAMALFTVLLVPALINGLRVSRWEGLVLLFAYGLLVTWQVRTTR